jgi:hypothetical protein
MKLTSGPDDYVKANPGKYPSRKAAFSSQINEPLPVEQDDIEQPAPKNPTQSKTLKLFRKKT